MCLRIGDLGFHWRGLRRAEDLEGVVMIRVVVVWLMDFLLLVRQIAREEAARCS